MFSKEDVDSILKQLQKEWGSDPQWEQLLRQAYLGMARADAGITLGPLDPRVIAIIKQHQKVAAQHA
ncbi:MAG TPA: hypothetical protein VE965_02375 [Gammaproteobacteria bacterium]|jgi:hypothetical protein|nr:hypothetical protein [Gammaproteobacteria bacterium]